MRFGAQTAPAAAVQGRLQPVAVVIVRTAKLQWKPPTAPAAVGLTAFLWYKPALADITTAESVEELAPVTTPPARKIISIAAVPVISATQKPAAIVPA